MSINKSIFYELCNKGIMVNLYKLLFLSSHFFFQPNKRVFHAPTFPSFQPNTHEEKLNIFHPPTFPSSHNFPPFHFSTPPTKRTLEPFPNKEMKKWPIHVDLGHLQKYILIHIFLWAQNQRSGFGGPNQFPLLQLPKRPSWKKKGPDPHDYS